MLSYTFPELSSEPLELSVTNDPHDTLIEIHDRSGDIKIFNAHSSMLCRRCEYFKVALSERWTRKVDDKHKLKLDDVSSDAFEIILKGISSGKIILNNLNTDTLMELILISDILLLYDFFIFLRLRLDEKRDKNKEWCDEDIVSILSISYRIPSTQDLYLFCQDIFVEKPLILFDSPEFTSIDEELLLNILRLDMICLPEIMIFNKLIEWGIANTPDFDPSTDNISRLKYTLENMLELIRYSNMSAEENKSTFKFNALIKKRYGILPRMNSLPQPKIITSRFIGLISAWIDRKDPMDALYTGLSTPFYFRHVFSMGDRTSFHQINHKYYNKSSDRLLPTIKCHHGPSLMIMKVRGSEKIIGAYNPINWKQDLLKKVYVNTTESFIFLSEDRHGTNHRLSRVRDFDHAICLESVNPSGTLLKFGEDLTLNPMRRSVSCEVGNKFYEELGEERRYEIESWDIYKLCRKDEEPMVVINEEVKQQDSNCINLPVGIKIIDSDFFGLIATWIDKKDPEEVRYTGSDMPFQFRPVFRMKDITLFYREHSKYYNKSTGRLLPTMKCHHGPSLMILKLKTGKIIGAYNPINWKQDRYSYTSTTTESFIFSSEDIHGIKHHLSRVKKSSYYAVYSQSIFSNGVLLRFGNGLSFAYNQDPDRSSYVVCRVGGSETYEKSTIIADGDYEIDEWEIFRVTRKIPPRIDLPIKSKWWLVRQ